jgi:hypothetical protein
MISDCILSDKRNLPCNLHPNNHGSFGNDLTTLLVILPLHQSSGICDRYIQPEPLHQSDGVRDRYIQSEPLHQSDRYMQPEGSYHTTTKARPKVELHGRLAKGTSTVTVYMSVTVTVTVTGRLAKGTSTVTVYITMTVTVTGRLAKGTSTVTVCMSVSVTATVTVTRGP